MKSSITRKSEGKVLDGAGKVDTLSVRVGPPVMSLPTPSISKATRGAFAAPRLALTRGTHPWRVAFDFDRRSHAMTDPRSLAGTNPNPAGDARLLADLQAARDHTAASVERLGAAVQALRTDIRDLLTAPEDVIDPSTAPVVRLGQGEYARIYGPGDLLSQAATHATRGRAVARLTRLKLDYAEAELAYFLSCDNSEAADDAMISRINLARDAMIDAAMAEGGAK